MKTIFGDRRTGKTTTAINLSSDTGAYIVCSDMKQATNIARMANEMKLKIPFPLTFHEFLEKQYYGEGIKSFIIDDLENLLRCITNVRISAVTFDQPGVSPCVMFTDGFKGENNEL